jgi:hypothetical protein
VALFIHWGARAAILTGRKYLALFQAKLSNELASFMKGLDFSQLAATATEDDAALDNAASSDNDQDDDDEEEDEDEEESDEGEMPMDTPKAKPKKEEAKKEDPKPEPSREKVDVKAAVAKVQGTGINAAPLGMPMGMGSLLKGKNGELVSRLRFNIGLHARLLLPSVLYHFKLLLTHSVRSYIRSSPPFPNGTFTPSLLSILPLLSLP